MPICPVCTVAIGAGLGISRVLGIDDAVTSTWIGALTLAFSFWLIIFINKKWPKLQITNYKLQIPVILTFYLFTLVPLYYTGYIGRSLNQIFGIDKILFGTTIGTVGMLFGIWLDQKQRQKWGKIFFPYQKVIFPVSILILLSLITEFLISNF